MSTRAARTLRGAAFAVVATLIAAVAHTMGGGGAPSPLFCAIVAALALPFSVAVAGPRVRAWRTWAAVAVSQVLFHAAFALTGDVGAWDAAASTHVHTHDLGLALPTAVAGEPWQPSMLLAHVAAGVVTALAVRRGESVLGAVARWTLRTLVPRLERVVAWVPVRRVVVAVSERTPPAPRILTEPVSRRGPPRLAVV